MVRKEIIDTILRKFLASPRHPKYLDKAEYKKDKSLIEHNATMYLSSAYYKDHWSYVRAKDSCRFMLDESKHNFVCGFPYQLGIEEGILVEEDVAEQMMESDFNEVTWSINISVLLKPIEPMPKGCASYRGANGGTLTVYAETIPCFIDQHQECF